MNNVLFTNGCSWTWGGALEPFYKTDEQRQKLVWPSHLGRLLNSTKVVNLGMGCGSNQRILRTTIDWIENQNTEDLSNVLAIIQWTEFSRYEFFIPENTENTDKWVKCKVGVVAGLPHSKNSDFEFYKELNYNRLSTYTDEEGFYSIVTYCEALDNIFKRHNIKYYYWFNIGQFNSMSEKQKNYLLKRFPFLNVDNSWKYDRISKVDDHPSLLGHRQLADFIFQNINNSDSNNLERQ